MAMIFVTKIENGRTTNEGLCLKCAKDLGIKPANDIIQKMGISDDELEAMTTELMDVINENDGSEDDTEDGKTATFPFLNRLFGSPGQESGANDAPPPGREKRDAKPPKKKFLESYCISLTERAVQGKLDRIVGRQAEIERVTQILNRRQKNNPCLIGEPGVGKTAVAEGFAQRVADGDVPEKLKNKEVYLLDLTSLVAGTQFRGQFESRMKGLIEEIKKLGNIVLVIDEVHSIVAAGDAEGSMNAANILKPALSRGEIQVIGATTFTEYRKHIEKDSALERRFQPVTINEPSVEETIEIIKGIAHYYESFHGVKITDHVARQAVILSERYITDRFLPDKAIDLIDEACSDVNLKDKSIGEKERMKADLQKIASERESLMEDTTPEAYQRLALLRSREMQLGARMQEAEDNRPELTAENLARVIELWTKIPASSIQEAEFERLKQLEDRLRERIIGQDEAVKTVAAAIRRGRVGISAKHKPVSFIFVGSTGVGKTELVKCLAQDLFNSPESLIRLDMSEFMEKHSVSRIIGAPPGYVGYDEAGQLTEKIRRKPYSVILFDEIEKAHPDVLNVLLQILDDGLITDAHGRQVNFENTVIIMTSNAGSERQGSGVMGFDRSLSEQSKDKAMKALSDIMRPEFINRVDEIVAFNQLSEEDFSKIVRIMLGDLKKSLAERNLDLSWDENTEKILVKKSYSVKYGARNLRRLIQKEIEDGIASVIIDNYEANPKGINITSEDGEKILILPVNE
jgi:ATP-dependent Clp protease ATP-binding subunit ClpA